MIPKKQTILHDPENGQHGNCMSAVIASLLHIPVESVPVFSAPAPQWQRDLNAFLKPFGLAYLTLSGTLDQHFDEIGIQGCHHEIAGHTVRSKDVLHACVAIDGRLRFDPHPDDTGLVETTSTGLFIAIEPWRWSQP